MTCTELRDRICHDLKSLGIDLTSFELAMKPYSKSYYGRYVPKKKRVIVYVYEDSDKTVFYPYEKLFSTVLHEVTHHLQWSDPEFKRIRGVMHNSEFYQIYNRLMRKHKIYAIVKRGGTLDSFSKKIGD